jgi:signal transduction histidine kinase
LLINRQVLSTIWRPFYESLEVIKSFKVNNSATLKLPLSSIEEFTLLNDHFRMAAGNAVQDYQRLKEFSENASHEIQTPLAIIRSNLDNMAQQESLTEKQSEHLQSVYTAVTKLSKLQQSLLLLTKLDNRQFHQQRSIRLDLEVKDKMSQFQELWQNKSIACTLESQDVNIEINKDLLDILLNNLFSNATRHNIENGSIHIIVDNSSLSIRNTGNPPALDPLRIFQRFYKSVANSESNGLGLSIIKEICDISCIQVLYQYQQGWHEFRLIW